MIMKTRILAALAALAVAACTAVSSNEGGIEEDRAELARLEAEARALARTEGCTAADQCRSAPLGVKACGGPRGYVVYCAASTDTVALFHRLEELRRAEEAFNRRYEVASDCALVPRPATELAGGTCRAQR